MGKVVNCTAVSLLQGLGPSSVGAVITDPPYFINMGRPDTPTAGVGHDPWSDESTLDGMIKWSEDHVREIHRVLRPGGAAVTMGGSQSLSAWEVAADRIGLKWMAELTVLWNTGKPRAYNFGSLTTTVRWHVKPGAKHVFNTQKRTIYSNVLVCDKIPYRNRVHPAQKPVELTNFFVSLLTNEGDLVVDPFCGSGSTLVSAAMCGRRWMGSDIDFEHAQRAQARASHWGPEEDDLNPLYLWVNGKLYPVEEDDGEINDVD